MSFMSKRRRLKFHVSCSLESLSSVPFVSGVLFAKLRLRDGGNFVECSTREEVKNHAIRWRKEFSFICKFTAHPSTLVLESRFLRVSIRKELKGGRAYEKLGYVDMNLAEYAGVGRVSRRYLLEGYDARHRLDNSILEVTVDMKLQSGDPVFKAQQPSGGIPAPLSEAAIAVAHVEESVRMPDDSAASFSSNTTVGGGSGGGHGSRSSSNRGGGSSSQQTMTATATFYVLPAFSIDTAAAAGSSGTATAAGSGGAEAEASSLASCSSGFSSLSKKHQRSSAAEVAGDRGHSRNSSYNSEMSNYGSYPRIGSSTQARQCATGMSAAVGIAGSSDLGHVRNPSSGSNREANRIMQSVRRLESERTERIDSTRVDPDVAVEEILGKMQLSIVEPALSHAVPGMLHHGGGLGMGGPVNSLQLYMADDGSTPFGSAKRKPR